MSFNNAATRDLARKRVFALGRLPKGEMNKLEKAYWEEVLQPGLLPGGDIEWAKFHGMKLRLADGTFYEPDFSVMRRSTGVLEQHEVKGYMLGDARAKLAISAGMYPFRFVLVQQVAKKDGRWTYEEF